MRRPLSLKALATLVRRAPNLALLLTGPLRSAPCSLRSLVAFGWKALQENASVMWVTPFRTRC
jgi:hypothetical protein